VADPVVLYQQADVFAFPTIEEGSALVTYEALACGLPAVTTYNAGSPVRDGQEGFLVPVQDAEALAERLDLLRTNVQLRLEMGRAARERAKTFTWHEYGENLVRAITRVSPH
jgi:glycosyltransferase involved in cell wall biosynthesis